MNWDELLAETGDTATDRNPEVHEHDHCECNAKTGDLVVEILTGQAKSALVQLLKVGVPGVELESLLERAFEEYEEWEDQQ